MSSNGFPEPKLVPPMRPQNITDHITYICPLSRRGTGPGIVLLTPEDSKSVSKDIRDGIPSARMKWAEEGYCVIEVRLGAWDDAKSDPLTVALETFASRTECQPKGNLGLVCYDTDQWKRASHASQQQKDSFVAAVLYAESTAYEAHAAHARIPTLFHLVGRNDLGIKEIAAAHTNGNGGGGGGGALHRTVHEYPSLASRHFARPFSQDFQHAAAAVAHSRDLAFLKPRMAGPYFDLEAVWDEHTYYEFGDRSVEKCMATMVQEPYVNHIPTITGGVGREALTAFYRDHFIYSNPDDSELDLISRTVGVDRIVDEFIFKATFDKPIHWLFPGVPPTGKPIQVPMTVVVNIRGDRLYHEHINWDSATALRQIGLLPQTATLSIPAAAHVNGQVANGNAEAVKQVEVLLPVAEGFDAVDKMRDKNAVQSNQMFANPIREI